MSVSYWGIVGYGIRLDDIGKYINKEKINILVRELNPNIEFNNEDNVLDDDTFSGDPYCSIAEFLTELDDTHSLIWDTSGNLGNEYLYYAPDYPWHKHEKDPKSFDEIRERIQNVIQKVYDIETEDLKPYITDICMAGYA